MSFDCSYHRCETCGVSYFGKHHSCGPKWHCIRFDAYEECKDDLDLWTEVYEDSAEEAAERFVRDDDSFSARFSDETIIVARDESGSLSYVYVRGDLEPVYDASEIDLEEAQRLLQRM